jgi:hypothetical protein
MDSVREAIIAAMVWWHAGKIAIEDSLSVSHASLHVFIGFLLWLGIAFVSRRPISSWLPWGATFAIILWSEIADVWTEQWPARLFFYDKMARDIALTMAIPTVLMVLARVRPQLFAKKGRGRK